MQQITSLEKAFRSAMHMVLSAVSFCTVLTRGISLDDMKLEEYKAISPVFEDDIYDVISMKNCVERRNTIGAPGADAMQAVIEQNKKIFTGKLKKTVAILKKIGIV